MSLLRLLQRLIIPQMFSYLFVINIFFYSLESCYYYRLYYAREAYLLSLESSLCSTESLPSSSSSSNLFLAKNRYASEEEYLQTLINQVFILSLVLNRLISVPITCYALLIIKNTLFLLSFHHHILIWLILFYQLFSYLYHITLLFSFPRLMVLLHKQSRNYSIIIHINYWRWYYWLIPL